jgi:ribose-phosphate pyrophosphokinase
LKIISGPTTQSLASRVAKELNLKPSLCEFKQFPDGELYTRILENEKNLDSVAIIQSTITDSDLISLLQLIDACESASDVTVIIPYMGYARQDKKFKQGEPISARAIARTIDVDSVFTVNIHEKNILNFFNAKSFDLDASNLLGNYISTLNLINGLILAPDKGALGIAQSVALDIEMDVDYLDKVRHSGDSISINPKEMEVEGRDVVIMDDMISTGGTMAESIKLLKKQGANNVYLACIHPVLTQNAVLKLEFAGVEKIIATDTIEKIQSCVSVSPLIADAIKNL